MTFGVGLFLIALSANLLLSGCASTRNYTAPNAPRYSGTATNLLPDPDSEIRVVSFNVEHARRISEAIELLRTAPGLQGADVVLLQEMDAKGVEAIADSLGMYWIYYPAMVSASA